jgi:UDP-N-acetylmuramate dehydrogenase
MYTLIRKVQALLPLEVEWEIWGEIAPLEAEVSR